MKKLLTVVLVAFAIGGAVLAIKNQSTQTGESVTGNSQPEPSQAQSETVPSQIIRVTYFTTNVRCPSCLKIEELTRQTVENRFPSEVAEGTVVFQLINTDLPENKHFINDYGLVSKTVVVAEFEKGTEKDWVNLQDVWLKFKDPEAFEQYVAEAVTAML